MHRTLGTAAAGRDRLTPCPRPRGPAFDRGHALGFAPVWFVTSSKNGVSAKVITIAVERTARDRLGRVHLQVADRAGELDMIEFATQVVAPGATPAAYLRSRVP